MKAKPVTESSGATLKTDVRFVSNDVHVSINPDENWANNAIQFPRFIEEAQAAGAFTNDVIEQMAQSMDLDVEEVQEIMERARKIWESIKGKM
jgi:energy-converting hydrogenase A subunit M